MARPSSQPHRGAAGGAARDAAQVQRERHLLHGGVMVDARVRRDDDGEVGAVERVLQRRAHELLHGQPRHVRVVVAQLGAERRQQREDLQRR
jgi:hypothetical protein